MHLRMLAHSAVFSILIAVGAVALNGAGLLDAQQPGHGRSDTYKSWGHHDD